MWTAISAKIEQLKKYDPCHHVFGASTHRYQRKPKLSEAELVRGEALLGFRLPELLRSYYQTIGNGIVGPCYGVLPMERLVAYQPKKDYLGAAYFKKIAEDHEEGHVYADGNWELDQDVLTGLLVIIPEGSGHEICLVIKGANQGKIAYVSTNGMVHDSNLNLVDLFQNWLDQELEVFEYMLDLMNKGIDEKAIVEQAIRSFDVYNGNERLKSLKVYLQNQ